MNDKSTKERKIQELVMHAQAAAITAIEEAEACLAIREAMNLYQNKAYAMLDEIKACKSLEEAKEKAKIARQMLVWDAEGRESMAFDKVHGFIATAKRFKAWCGQVVTFIDEKEGEKEKGPGRLVAANVR